MTITPLFILFFLASILLTVITLVVETKLVHTGIARDTTKWIVNPLRFLIVLSLIGMGIQNFQATLTVLVFAAIIITVIDRLFFHKKRVLQQRSRTWVIENAYSFLWVLIVVWIIRSYLVQPYRVPTGSLQPTVEPGDFLVVNQFAYGLHFPIGNKEFLPVGKPQRGDIALFYYPLDLNVIFVKRVIGLPGDHIESRNQVLYINGKEMKQTFLSKTTDNEPAEEGNPEEHIAVNLKEENLDGIKHKIYLSEESNMLSADFKVDVPPGRYFMMGDNRDNSADSRVWGFVPEENVIGKAFGIWMSWDSLSNSPRLNRIGMKVQ